MFSNFSGVARLSLASRAVASAWGVYWSVPVIQARFDGRKCHV